MLETQISGLGESGFQVVPELVFEDFGIGNLVGDFVLGEKSGFGQEGFVGFQIAKGEGAGEGGTEDPEFAEVIVGFDEFLDIDDAVGLYDQAGFFVGFGVFRLNRC